jgi:hypothetical protein
LNLPPAKRPALGKGPTGEDKPKAPAAPPPRLSQAVALEFISRAGSPADSPTFTRAQSLSPSTNIVHSLEDGSWDQGMIMGEEQNQSAPHASSSSTAYPLPGVPPAHSKTPSQFPYRDPSPALSESGTILSDRYPPSLPYGSGNKVRDLRDDQGRFAYSQPSYSGGETTHLSQHSPSTNLHYPQQQQ